MEQTLKKPVRYGVILFVSTTTPPRYFFHVQKIHKDHRDKVLPKGEIVEEDAADWFNKQASNNLFLRPGEVPLSFIMEAPPITAEVFVVPSDQVKVDALQGPLMCWRTKEQADSSLASYSILDLSILAAHKQWEEARQARAA